MPIQKYTVRILDSYHFMGEGKECNSGNSNTCEKATLGVKLLKIFGVDASTDEIADRLYETYVMFGEMPIIDGKKSGSFRLMTM